MPFNRGQVAEWLKLAPTARYKKPLSRGRTKFKKSTIIDCHCSVLGGKESSYLDIFFIWVNLQIQILNSSSNHARTYILRIGRLFGLYATYRVLYLSHFVKFSHHAIHFKFGIKLSDKIICSKSSGRIVSDELPVYIYMDTFFLFLHMTAFFTTAVWKNKFFVIIHSHHFNNHSAINAYILNPSRCTISWRNSFTV